MRTAALLTVLLALSACTWETYETADGRTSLRQRYAPGTPVVYQDGTFARDQRYNAHRPVPVPVLRDQQNGSVPRTTWDNGADPAAAEAPPAESR